MPMRNLFADLVIKSNKKNFFLNVKFYLPYLIEGSRQEPEKRPDYVIWFTGHC